jgi:hypothetical protein
MITGFSLKRFVRVISRYLLPFGFLVVLISLMSGHTLPAKADAGGWPTATPTATMIVFPTSTFTPIPTSALLPFPVFATPTPTGAAPSFLSSDPNQQNFALQAPAPTPQPGRFSVLACWPVAILLVIVAIVIFWWLRHRVIAQVP